MATQKLNGIVTIGAAYSSASKRNVSLIKAGLQDISGEIKKVTTRQKELTREKANLLKQGKAVDHLEKEYAELEQQLAGVTSQQRKWENAQGAVNRVGQRWGELTGNVKRNAVIMGGAITAIAAGSFRLADSTAQAAREVRNFSMLANTSPRVFQRWAAAAETVGLEQDKVGDILKDVNDRVGDFLQTGGGPMADFFENIAPKVGVTAEQFKGLSGADALQLYVSSLEKAGVNQQEMVFYMEAMASDASALVPLLADNGREMERLGDRAEATGRVLDENAIKSAQAFDAAMGEARGTMIGLRNTMGTALLPAVTELATEFSDFVIGNQDGIQKFGESFAGIASQALPVVGQVATGLVAVASTTGQVTSAVATMVGGWENFGMILGGVFAARTIGSALKFGGSIFSLGRAMIGLSGTLPAVGVGIKAIGAAVAANPIGLAIAAIAGGAFLIYRNWDRITSWFHNFDWGNLIPKIEWSGFVPAFSWSNVFTFLDWLSWLTPIRWLDFIPGFSWSERLKKLNIGDKVTGLNWADFVSNFSWSNVLKPLQWLGVFLNPIKWLDFIPLFSWSERFTKLKIGDFIGRWNWKNVLPTFSWGQIFSKLNPWDFITGRGRKSASSDEKLQKRARGGPFRPGALLVGEDGPELMFPNRGGFIANNRETQELLARNQRAKELIKAAPRTAAQSQHIAPQNNYYNNITIQAVPGQSAETLAREIIRQQESRNRAALFDNAGAW